MKLKQKPGDFQVREVFSFEEDPTGEYFVHRLRKEKVDTLEALDRIAQRGDLPREDIAYAGLKDRQGLTEQFFSIKGRKVEFRDPDLKVSFIGRSARPVTSKMSDGNRFTIVIRDLGTEEVVRMRRNKTALMSQGLPNYFDDQRFGSLAQGQGLVMLPIYKRKPDIALKQLFATPSMKANARGGDQKLRQLLKEHWGDWQTCKNIARGPMYRAIFEHLIRFPEDFRGALERIPMRLKLIHLYSFQSALWNRAVSRYISYSTQGSFTIPSLNGPLSYWRYLDEEQHAQLGDKELELIAPDTQCEDRLFRRTVENVLREMGLQSAELRVAIKGLSLKEENRRLILKPEGFRIEGPEPDETNRGRFKVTLHFQLPRGSYATLVVKRLFAGARVPRSQHGAAGDRGPRHGDRVRALQRAGEGRPHGGSYRDRRDDRDDRRERAGARRDHRDDRGGYQGGRRDHRDQRDDRGGYQGGRRDHREQRDNRGGYQGGRRDHRDQRDDRGGYQGGRRDHRDQRDDRGGYQGRGRDPRAPRRGGRDEDRRQDRPQRERPYREGARRDRGGHGFFEEEKQALPTAIRRKGPPAKEPREDQRQDPRQKPRQKPRQEPRQEPRPESRREPRGERIDATQVALPKQGDQGTRKPEKSTEPRKKTRRVSVLRRLLK